MGAKTKIVAVGIKLEVPASMGMDEIERRVGQKFKGPETIVDEDGALAIVVHPDPDVIFPPEDETRCIRCGQVVALFDKAPSWAKVNGGGQGWATDLTGDPVEGFICPARETSARFPDGKPHEVTP
jgi:hypothetical protein